MPRKQATPGEQPQGDQNPTADQMPPEGQQESSDNPPAFVAPTSQDELDALVNAGIAKALEDNETVQGMIADQVAAAVAKAEPRKQPLSTDRKLPTQQEAKKQAENSGKAVLSEDGHVLPPAKPDPTAGR